MPIVKSSTYKAPWWSRNGHVATIIPSLFKKVEGVNYSRERIDTPDDDFMDLDWLRSGNENLLLLAHGLEGSADRHYMKSPAKFFHAKGWDAVAWNSRTCSGEMNRVKRLYHHGATDDLETVVNYINTHYSYKRIVLAGFSMGGSLILKYLGEREPNLPENIDRAVTFSVPCHIKSSALELSKSSNRFYRRRFLSKLKEKIRLKAERFPDEIDVTDIDKIDHFPDFEERYTAPLHGFKNADDFYGKVSAHQFLETIPVKTLIVNAINDPFFPEACYPVAIVEKLKNVYLEMPKHGGHVGFSLKGGKSWMDQRIWEFVNS